MIKKKIFLTYENIRLFFNLPFLSSYLFIIYEFIGLESLDISISNFSFHLNLLAIIHFPHPSIHRTLTLILHHRFDSILSLSVISFKAKQFHRWIGRRSFRDNDLGAANRLHGWGKWMIASRLKMERKIRNRKIQSNK